MRWFKIAAAVLALGGLFVGCSKTNLPTSVIEASQGLDFNMDLSAIKDSKFNVTRVTAYITKGSFSDSMNLTISGENAYGTFMGLFVGTYSIVVKAYDGDQLLATGEGKGVVKPAQTTRVYISMRYVGNLEIWIGYIPWEGMAAEYVFNGNAVDESGNGFNGTLYGPTLCADRFGKADKAYNFNGIDNYISLAPTSEMGLTDSSITISAWFNVSTFDQTFHGDQAIIGNDSVEWTYGCLQVLIRTDTSYGGTHIRNPLFGFYTTAGTGNADLYGATTIEPQIWMHILVSYDRTTKLQSIYINGQCDTSMTTDGNYTGTSNLMIGRVIGGLNVLGSNYFTGSIDDVRIYRRALTNEEIQALYHENGWDW